ncbi:NUMOD4 domain-containing protein [Leuconostoc mesenteroides]
MIEVWEDIKGYEGLYKVSNLGNIKNRHNHYLKYEYNKKGYQRVQLCKNSISKTHFVHRLVAIAFIPNTNKDYDQINHKNEIRDYNVETNLEWCDAKYNNNYGNHKANLSTPITVTDPSGSSYRFQSVTQAVELIGSKLGDYNNNEEYAGLTWSLPKQGTTYKEAKKYINHIKEVYVTNQPIEDKIPRLNHNTKPIVGISNSGESFYYRSAKASALILGTYPSMVTAVLKGKRKTTKGYTFRYLTDQEATEHEHEMLPRLEEQLDLLKVYKEAKQSKVKTGTCEKHKLAELLEDGTDYIYESIAEASRATGIERSLISKNVSGKTQSTHGRTFEYD